MTAKQLREWCERMGDDAEVVLQLTTYYSMDWATKFVAINDIHIDHAYGSGQNGGTGKLTPQIVLPASHTIKCISHPCPVCQRTPEG